MVRPLPFTRGAYSSEETLNAQVLVDVGPVDALAVTEKLPVRALRRGGLRQTWEPHERDGDCAAVA